MPITANKLDEVARIGAGGAIVTLSDAEDEYEEMRLKATASARALSYGRMAGSPVGH